MVASLIAAIHLQQKQFLLHITVQILHTHLHIHTVQFGYFNTVNKMWVSLQDCIILLSGFFVQELFKVCTPGVGPTQPHIQRGPEPFSPQVKPAACEPYHSPQQSVCGAIPPSPMSSFCTLRPLYSSYNLKK